MLCRSLNEDRSPAKNMLLLLLLLLALFVLSKQRIIYQMDVAVNNRTVMRWFFLIVLGSNTTSIEATFISSIEIEFVNDWPLFCEFVNYQYDIHCYCQFLEKIVQQVYF